MSGKNTAVFGIYPTYADVEEGVEALKEAGFRNTDISILMPENQCCPVKSRKGSTG